MNREQIHRKTYAPKTSPTKYRPFETLCGAYILAQGFRNNHSAGGATLVVRLAVLTGVPYQSPAWLTARPEASPTRSRGRSCAAAAETRSRTTFSNDTASGH